MDDAQQQETSGDFEVVVEHDELGWGVFTIDGSGKRDLVARHPEEEQARQAAKHVTEAATLFEGTPAPERE